MIDRLGEVIAKRMVADGDRSVLIEVGRPRPAAGAGGDVCGFRIQGWGESRATGVDALAALYRALVEIGAQLTQANEAGAQFTVAGPAELGFPAPPTRDDIAHDPGMEYELGDLLAIRTLIAAAARTPSPSAARSPPPTASSTCAPSASTAAATP